MSDTDYTPDQTVSNFTTRDLDKHIRLRPAILTDLDASLQHGDQVATVQISAMPFKMFAKIGAFVELFDGNKDFILERDYRGDVTIYKTATPQQVDERIGKAANQWDLAGEQYDTIVATQGTEPSEWAIQYNIRTYSDKMGIPRPWALDD